MKGLQLKEIKTKHYENADGKGLKEKSRANDYVDRRKQLRCFVL